MNKYCLGYHCPIKNQCRRYTHRTDDDVMRSCSNQKGYMQDTENINVDSLRR